jgi:hypothetical protein
MATSAVSLALTLEALRAGVYSSAMPHPLVLALFTTRDRAATAARALHAAGVTAAELSVVARDHEDEGALASVLDATPGADLEDSRLASRLGELSAHVLTAMSILLPGVGPALASGPLAAELGEAAGHVAGGLPAVLREAGIDEGQALAWRDAIEAGAVLLGVHAVGTTVERIEDALREESPDALERAVWE